MFKNKLKIDEKNKYQIHKNENKDKRNIKKNKLIKNNTVKFNIHENQNSDESDISNSNNSSDASIHSIDDYSTNRNDKNVLENKKKIYKNLIYNSEDEKRVKNALQKANKALKEETMKENISVNKFNNITLI